MSTAATALPPSRQRAASTVRGTPKRGTSTRRVGPRCCTATRSSHDTTWRVSPLVTSQVCSERVSTPSERRRERNRARTLPGETSFGPCTSRRGRRRPGAVAEHQHGRDRGAGLGHRLLDGHLPEVADARHAPQVGQGLPLSPGQGVAAWHTGETSHGRGQHVSVDLPVGHVAQRGVQLVGPAGGVLVEPEQLVADRKGPGSRAGTDSALPGVEPGGQDAGQHPGGSRLVGQRRDRRRAVPCRDRRALAVHASCPRGQGQRETRGGCRAGRRGLAAAAARARPSGSGRPRGRTFPAVRYSRRQVSSCSTPDRARPAGARPISPTPRRPQRLSAAAASSSSAPPRAMSSARTWSMTVRRPDQSGSFNQDAMASSASATSPGAPMTSTELLTAPTTARRRTGRSPAAERRSRSSTCSWPCWR